MEKLYVLFCNIMLQYIAVVSFVETWIEIVKQSAKQVETSVVSFVETWIEIPQALRNLHKRLRRLLRGDVD